MLTKAAYCKPWLPQSEGAAMIAVAVVVTVVPGRSETAERLESSSPSKKDYLPVVAVAVAVMGGAVVV